MGETLKNDWANVWEKLPDSRKRRAKRLLRFVKKTERRSTETA
jgi:hypothetical protein